MKHSVMEHSVMEYGVIEHRVMRRRVTRNGQTHSERGGTVFTIFLILTFVGIISAGLVAFTFVSHAHPWSPAFYETEPPVIEWVHEPLGIGADLAKAKLKVTDTGAGLDEVVVRLSQRNKPTELVKRRSGAQSISLEEIDLTIDAKALALREGKAELEILAFDRTMWSNGTRVSLPLPVDFAKPRIDVITPQQNAVEGGTELVFFKVVGKKPTEQGVVLQGTLFPGFPAKYWDESFKNYDDLYLAFFSIPIGFDEHKGSPYLSARDDIGNSATAPFSYRAKQRRFGTPTTAIDPAKAELLTQKLSEFVASKRLTLRGPSATLPEKLATLLKAARTYDEAALSNSFTEGDGKKWWSGSFGRPVSSLPSSSMGEQRTFTVDGMPVFDSPSSGVRFAVGSRQTVTATNAGRVSFVGSLGFYGTTVVIDHGFGLATVYGHLSEATVTVGQELTLGSPIGRTGDTGFALGEETFFETRMHGMPVSPNEWWDTSWVEDHITKKVAFVQGTLIGNPGE